MSHPEYKKYQQPSKCECKGKGVIKTSGGNIVGCPKHRDLYDEKWSRLTKDGKIEFINLRTGKVVN